MKKKLIIFTGTLLVLALISSCDELFNMFSFGTGEYAVKFSIPPMEAGTFKDQDTIESNIMEILEENNITDINSIEKVTLKKATFEILKGEKNFNKIKKAVFFIGGPELDDRVICWKDSIPADTNIFSFSMSEENLLDYLAIEEYWVKCEVTLCRDIKDTVDVQATIEYEITPGSTGSGL